MDRGYKKPVTDTDNKIPSGIKRIPDNGNYYYGINQYLFQKKPESEKKLDVSDYMDMTGIIWL